MTIPRRAESAASETGVQMRGKLLTELPHVGEQAVVSAASSSPANRSHHFDQTALLNEESLQLDESARSVTRRRQRHYVDQAHLDDWELADYANDYDHDLRQSRDRTSRSLVRRQRQTHCKSRPKSLLGAILSQGQERVAPFAGLIVTAALVAAAGLLFHMMSDGQPPDADFEQYALPGFQVEAIDDHLQTDQTAPLAEAAPIDDTTESADLRVEPADSGPTEKEAKSTPSLDTRAEVSTPPTENTAIASLPLGQLAFPLTDSPRALDYTKAVDPELQQLPAVAERPETADDAINR